MSELTREQIEELERGVRNRISDLGYIRDLSLIKNYALRTHDAEHAQFVAESNRDYWKERALAVEHENADLALRLQQSLSEKHAKHRAWEEADRRAESYRQKLQQAERYQEELSGYLRESRDRTTEILRRVKAMHSLNAPSTNERR